MWTYPVLNFQSSVPLWQLMGPDAPTVVHGISHPLLNKFSGRWVSSDTGVSIRLGHRFPAHQHDQENNWHARKEQPSPTTPDLVPEGCVILYGWTGVTQWPPNGDKTLFPNIPLLSISCGRAILQRLHSSIPSYNTVNVLQNTDHYWPNSIPGNRGIRYGILFCYFDVYRTYSMAALYAISCSNRSCYDETGLRMYLIS